jgi:hypothetical protein
VVCDEAHKRFATFFGGEIKYTKRYLRLGRHNDGADALQQKMEERLAKKTLSPIRTSSFRLHPPSLQFLTSIEFVLLVFIGVRRFHLPGVAKLATVDDLEVPAEHSANPCSAIKATHPDAPRGAASVGR